MALQQYQIQRMAPIESILLESLLIYPFEQYFINNCLILLTKCLMSLRERRGDIVLEGEGFNYKDKLPYFEGVNLVGRNPSKTTITIKDRSISEIHAKIICKGKSIKVIDAKSKNGVYLNNLENQIDSEKQIEVNPKTDTVYFAQVKCKFIPCDDTIDHDENKKQFTIKNFKPAPKPSNNQGLPDIKQNQKDEAEQHKSKEQKATKLKGLNESSENSMGSKGTKKPNKGKNQNDKIKQKQQLLKDIIEEQKLEQNKDQKKKKQKIGIKKTDTKPNTQANSKTSEDEKKKDKKSSKQKAEKEPEQKDKKQKLNQRTKMNQKEEDSKAAERNQFDEAQKTKQQDDSKSKKANKTGSKNNQTKKSKESIQKEKKKMQQKRSDSGETKVKSKKVGRPKSTGNHTNNIQRKTLQQRKKMPGNQALNESFSHPKRKILQKVALVSGAPITFNPTTKITITHNWKDKFDVLVMDKYLRTFKLLYAICLGVPVVTKNWIIESEYRRGVTGFQRFLLQAPEKDLISNSISLVQNGHKVFKNLNFYLIETQEQFHIPSEQIEALIETGGGNLLKKLNHKQVIVKEVVFIVRLKYGSEDLKAIKKIEGAQKIYTVQMILDSCLRQDIKWDENKVK